MQLDTWVFDKVRKMFEAAAVNSTLDTELRQDKNIFFLHLLGLDMNGHAYRPYSKEYLHNIKMVDQGVEQMAKLVKNFYGDDETAFIFTADHGMSDWGSHGDGHPDNTRTPLIAWGSGVRTPIISTQSKAYGHEDGFSADWNLDHIQRNDVNQADIAALMAYLVGIEFPVNSVGELPLPYLSCGLAEQAEASLVNVQELLEMYRVKEEQKRQVELRYRPFPAFSAHEDKVEHRLARIRQSIDSADYEVSIKESRELLRLGLDGLRYLQTYDWLFLRALVTIGYLGWIAFAVTTVINLHVLGESTIASRSSSTNAAFGALLVVVYSDLWIRKSPLTYYTYAFFPIVFWEEVVARRRALIAGKDLLLHNVTSRTDALDLGLKSLGSIALLEALVRIRKILSWLMLY